MSIVRTLNEPPRFFFFPSEKLVINLLFNLEQDEKDSVVVFIHVKCHLVEVN